MLFRVCFMDSVAVWVGFGPSAASRGEAWSALGSFW